MSSSPPSSLSLQTPDLPLDAIPSDDAVRGELTVKDYIKLGTVGKVKDYVKSLKGIKGKGSKKKKKGKKKKNGWKPKKLIEIDLYKAMVANFTLINTASDMQWYALSVLQQTRREHLMKTAMNIPSKTLPTKEQAIDFLKAVLYSSDSKYLDVRSLSVSTYAVEKYIVDSYLLALELVQFVEDHEGGVSPPSIKIDHWAHASRLFSLKDWMVYTMNKVNERRHQDGESPLEFNMRTRISITSNALRCFSTYLHLQICEEEKKQLVDSKYKAMKEARDIAEKEGDLEKYRQGMTSEWKRFLSDESYTVDQLAMSLQENLKKILEHTSWASDLNNKQRGFLVTSEENLEYEDWIDIATQMRTYVKQYDEREESPGDLGAFFAKSVMEALKKKLKRRKARGRGGRAARATSNVRDE